MIALVGTQVHAWDPAGQQAWTAQPELVGEPTEEPVLRLVSSEMVAVIASGESESEGEGEGLGIPLATPAQSRCSTSSGRDGDYSRCRRFRDRLSETQQVWPRACAP